MVVIYCQENIQKTYPAPIKDKDYVNTKGQLIKVELVRYTKLQQEHQLTNNAPVVKIIIPKNNSRYEWNTPIRYNIIVSDKEDGESKFQEILSSEVSLEVRYQPDTSLVSS